MNSVLNAIYTDVCCGESLIKGSSLHNGDDVLIGATNMETARASLAGAAKHNIRIQPAKCSFGGIAEFLRIDHRRGSKGQYMTRAIATLVHSRIESKISTDARDLVQSMENRFSDCKARDVDPWLIANLRELYYQRQSLVCEIPKECFYTIKETHRTAGGISECLDAQTVYKIEPGVLNKNEILIPPLPGVSAYAKQLAQALQMTGKERMLRKRLERATYEAVVPKNRKMKKGLNSERQWCDNVKAIYKAFRGTIPVAGFGKAALVGLAVDLLAREKPDSTLNMALARSPDPIRLLGFIL